MSLNRDRPARELNLSLQRALNPPRSSAGGKIRLALPRREGNSDREQLRKEVFNGDIACESIDPVEQEVATGLINGRSSTTLANWMRSRSPMRSPYTKPRIRVPGGRDPLATQQYMLLQRNLIYTGITRGKKLVVLIGQRKALRIAVSNNKTQRRYSGLLETLTAAGGSSVPVGAS